MNIIMIDIVTPTLNSDNYLEETILSTKHLRKTGSKHLVCDSGSSDSTLQILHRHNIPSIYCVPGNMYHAINAGIKTMDNDWCTYINSDDVVYHKGLLDALKTMGGDADVIYGNIDTMDEQGIFLYHFKSSPVNQIKELFGSGIMPFGQPGTLFRRFVWNKLKGFDEQYLYSSDYDFFMRAFLEGFRFKHYNHSPIAGFREHKNQFSHKALDRMRVERVAVSDSIGYKVNNLKKIIAKSRFRMNNFESYICRKLRNNHVHGL